MVVEDMMVDQVEDRKRGGFVQPSEYSECG